MLALIGLGLEAEDISLKGLKLVQACDTVYLEKYTSILLDESEIERVIGRKPLPAFREDIEASCTDPKVLQEAQTKSVALLVVGTPLFATTHTELLIRAQELNIPVQTIHNASIQSVMGCCGFNSYGFGRTVSIPFFLKEWRVYDFYQNIMANYQNGLHTLCLLDIKINEPTLETLMGKENKRYTRFMSIDEAINQIQEAAQHWQSNDLQDQKIVGVERFGQATEQYTYGTLQELATRTYGPPLHAIIIPSNKGSSMEREYVERFFNHTSTTQ
ncbi:diphthine methyl ester synthase [Nematocida homosporus]|uniref:diphthine methyl ester synthase n=1 Tax=Nematocida homosporus TaxID=1912981 RepID=UPI002220F9C6|nr:diphthine methyl ester synthase [Nematocida homosporus]KAI5184721.1 diphthine methyl ester synthase [Nematocida homosporus]